MHLNHAVGDEAGGLRGEQLGVQRAAAQVASLLGLPRGVIDQVAQRLHLGRRIGDVILDGLLVRNRPAELDALGGELYSSLDRRQAQSQPGSRHRQSKVVEHVFDNRLTIALRAQAIGFRHVDVVQVNGVDGRAAQAQGQIALAQLEARRVFFNQKGREAASIRARIASGNHYKETRDAGVHHPRLDAVQHIAIVNALGASRQRPRIASSVRLGQRKRAHRFT